MVAEGSPNRQVREWRVWQDRAGGDDGVSHVFLDSDWAECLQTPKVH